MKNTQKAFFLCIHIHNACVKFSVNIAICILGFLLWKAKLRLSDSLRTTNGRDEGFGSADLAGGRKKLS